MWLDLFFRMWDKIMKFFIASQGGAEREMQRVSGTSPKLRDSPSPPPPSKLAKYFYLDCKTLDGGSLLFITVLCPCGYRG